MLKTLFCILGLLALLAVPVGGEDGFLTVFGDAVDWTVLPATTEDFIKWGFIEGITEPLDIKWKTGEYYIIEFSPWGEKPFAFGLREDGVVVWKYTDSQQGDEGTRNLTLNDQEVPDEDDPGYITTEEIMDSNPFSLPVEGEVDFPEMIVPDQAFSFVIEDVSEELRISVTPYPYDQIIINNAPRRIEIIHGIQNTVIKIFTKEKIIILHEPGWMILRDYNETQNP